MKGNPVKERDVMSLAFYKENRYQYVITDSVDYGSYFGGKNQSRFPSIARFYGELFSQAQLVKEFTPDFCECPGPTVKKFKLQ